MKKALLCVGNPLMGDDAVGLYLGRLAEERLSGWRVFYGYETPEEAFGEIRSFAPDILVVADAVVGETQAKFIELGDSDYMYNTHNMPLALLIAALRESVARTLFLGIGIDPVNVALSASQMLDAASNKEASYDISEQGISAANLALKKLEELALY